jgi:hypothetical protein
VTGSQDNDIRVTGSVLPVQGKAARDAASSKTQRQFAKVIERLTAQRQEIRLWQAYQKVYQQKLASEYQPLATRLREKRIALVQILDRGMEAASLAKRELKKLRAMLDHMVSELLAEAEEPELVRIHDKYADVSFGEAKRVRMELLKAMASEEYGIDVEAYAGEESPEDLTEWLREQVRAAKPEPAPPKPRKGAKSSAELGPPAVREVFRKLVSELHPDRESDPTEHARKTELMQRVNRAYKSGDLLSLLELQARHEQSDAKAVTGLADKRLRHYIQVLEDQSRRMREELAQIIAPFNAVVGEPRPRTITPAAVQRALEADIVKLKATLRTVEMDLIRFKNTRNLKQSLEHYWFDPR